MRVAGLDRSPAMLKRATRKGQYTGLAIGDVVRAPFADARFDLAISVLAACHVADINAFYGEAPRLVRPEGYVVLVDYHPFILVRGIPTHFKTEAGAQLAIENWVHFLEDHVAAARTAGLALLEMRERIVRPRLDTRQAGNERYRERARELRHGLAAPIDRIVVTRNRLPRSIDHVRPVYYVETKWIHAASGHGGDLHQDERVDSMNELKTQRPRFRGYAPEEDNPVLETLLAHRSVRAYKDAPVPEKAVDLILEAAIRAPTSSNLNSYAIVVIDDRDLLEKMYAVCGKQPFVAKCGVLLVFCSDISRHVHVCAKRGYPYRGDQINTLFVTHGDAILACQNAAVAAESMGFGTCMLGNVRNDPPAVSDLLALPRYVFASVGLAIGVADEDMGLKPRMPRRVMVSRNRYSSEHMEDGLAEYDETMRLTGCYLGRREPLNDVDPDFEDHFTDETYGWIEHTARRLGGKNQFERRNFGAFLDSKGFSRR
ncbi:MAG: nitroreductase family protein [Rhodospirillales bacterium]|nr:nitroreductase family protein [Rhodospirillales bacterium]